MNQYTLSVLFCCFALSPITKAFNQQVTEKILTISEADDRYASYSPDGSKIVFESNRSGKWNIYLMESDGTNQQRLTSSESRRPSWHPSSKKILFESKMSGKSELYEIHIKSKKIKKIKTSSILGELGFARYSPDGKLIALTLNETEQKSNILLISRRGKRKKMITNSNLRSFYPNWSPDGKELIFSSRFETNNIDDEIYKVNITTLNTERLTNWPKHNFCPVWSNDGKKIAYVTSMDSIRPEIYIMDANGKNQERITYNNSGDTLPSWSGDGKKLLISGFRNGNYEICELSGFALE